MNDNIYDQLLTNANYNINYSRFPGSRIALTWEFEQVKQNKLQQTSFSNCSSTRSSRAWPSDKFVEKRAQTWHSLDPFVCIVFRSLSTERNQSQSKKSENMKICWFEIQLVFARQKRKESQKELKGSSVMNDYSFPRFPILQRSRASPSQPTQWNNLHTLTGKIRLINQKILCSA